MTQTFRTHDTGRIRRDRPLRFTFDGRGYTGFEGDTLASALLANDVHLVARSFKYHRPRGILTAGPEEPNALVTIDRGAGRVTPNLRATQVELYDGLRAISQNRYPSLRFDLGASAGLASPLLSAGFYYKTFMWPAAFWKRLYEPMIRATAGFGRAPLLPDPDRYLHQYAHCDVLVIGAGPAGLTAALAAVSRGARVILADEQPEPGGSLLAEPDAMIDGWPAPEWLAEVLRSLTGSVTLLPRTTAFGWYPDNLIGLAERVTDHLPHPGANQPRERLWQVRSAEVVIATGAIERPLVFPQNDRPGIMLAHAARTYLLRYGVKVGARVVVATADDSAYRVALDLQRAGIPVAGIVDERADAGADVLAAAEEARIPVHRGRRIAATEGRMRVHSVKLSDGTQVIPCDTVLMCGGWTPSVHLFAQSRGRLRFDSEIGAFLPGELPARARSAGACAGLADLVACLADGYRAGGGGERQFEVHGMPVLAPSGLPDPGPPHPKAFVDFQNDVTSRDLAQATREGFRSIEHVKRYTTAGMGTDQGKTSNLNALVSVAGLLGRSVPEVGLTTYRPPYTPVTFGTLAGAARGALFDPVRQAPMHDWAEANRAVFEDVGPWKRARYFPRGTEDMRQAVDRECRAVRNSVGLFDASTLGKIEVVGPDAANFLDRLYTVNLSSLPVGRCRYGLLLGEDGFIRDDGVIARIAPDRFHVTTTTGGAASVLHHMEDYLQTEFTDLRVWLTSTTEQWAVIAVQGPRSGDVLSPLVAGNVLSTMPHMSVRACEVAGVPARLFRVSFTGEPGFEINVPTGSAQRVWDAVLAAGAAFGVTPYGTEAMHVLRAEAGFVIVGQETDGTVTPFDLGLGWAIGKAKRDFVGKRSLARPDLMRDDRPQLVGLITGDPAFALEEGAQVTAARGTGAPSVGHVTSAYHSQAVGRSIALALVRGGRARIGSTMFVPLGNRTIDVTVTPPRFVPPHPDPLPRGQAPLPAPVADAVFAPADRGPRHFANPALRVTALAPTLSLSVRAGTAAATSIGAAIGVLLGSVPCRAVVSRDRAALWLGPDEWLVLAPETETDLAGAAAKAAGDAPCSIVDVSHRATSLEVAGPWVAWCLNAFCALDLDPGAFPVGMCTRTLLGKAEIVLWRLGNETFHIEVARSLASYVWACLHEAAREFDEDAPIPTHPAAG
ncbi:MAG: sarcosine oxidase subunit alpha family protein [Acetobacteraceae bacterium]